MKYGAKMIAESTLQAVENSNPERDYEVNFTIPEFTCLCPQSNFPDFATIRIRYIPDRKLVELKSLKLYINRFRDQEMFSLSDLSSTSLRSGMYRMRMV